MLESRVAATADAAACLPPVTAIVAEQKKASRRAKVPADLLVLTDMTPDES